MVLLATDSEFHVVAAAGLGNDARAGVGQSFDFPFQP